jgi:hypothetical protein
MGPGQQQGAHTLLLLLPLLLLLLPLLLLLLLPAILYINSWVHQCAQVCLLTEQILYWSQWKALCCAG